MLQGDDAGYVVGGAGGDSERGICRGASGGDCTAAVFLSAVAGRMPHAAVQRLRGGDGGGCRLIGKLEILVDRMYINIGDFGR